MIRVIQLRLVAETEADALAAIEMLVDGVGSARIAISAPREGRKGQWLSYGSVQVDELASQYATGRAVTGPTTRLRKR
jgi:hypothetical protein